MKNRKYILTLLLAINSLCEAAPSHIVVTGTTLDCFLHDGPVYRTAGIEVFVFPKTQQLVNLINSMHLPPDDKIFERFEKLLKFIRGPGALARTKSDSRGLFRMEIPVVERIIVLGYLETEDKPLYWMYREVFINKRSTVSVTLDACKCLQRGKAPVGNCR